MSMIKRIPEGLGLIAALVLAGACDTLKIDNPNAPDSPRALSDPSTVQSIAVGAMRTWYLTTQGDLGADAYPALTMVVMARSHVAAWNNYNIRFYTGCTTTPWDVYTAATNGTCGTEQLGATYPRIEWQNDPASAQRTQIEPLWYGYYSALSSANDVLKAIRQKGLVITDGETTKMVETMATLVQALSLSGIALNYDQGFIVTDSTPVDANGSPIVAFKSDTALRDTAMAKFDAAIAMAATKFGVPGEFFGSPAQSYTNVHIAQIANTMAARTLAYFPRNAAQNAAVDWVRVASYASKGISSGAAFDWMFHDDACASWCDWLKVWSNDMTTMRIHSRVAHLLDPVNQPDPWDITKNSQPNSPDQRLGDGTYRGGASYAKLISAIVDTHTVKRGGLDYVWSTDPEIQNKSRGAWHQSAVGQVRYDSLATCGDNPQGEGTGSGDAPAVLAAENDLIWAEALIRQTAGDLTLAATLINHTRVGPDLLGRPRGGASPTKPSFLPASAADGQAGLLQKLQYEQDVELPGSNPAPFYNQRRIDKLEPLTPREMPVPAKELGVLKLSLYTCGGAAHPDGSCDVHPAPSPIVAALVTNAPQVWASLERQSRDRAQLNTMLGRRR
ncbi:MAG: hypothetical protein DMD55_15605 [Gemmatimonadetes bacterium]|nr:MAG: hypothetical protein DMD55_15605 [Gemmatimonadota bacterium]